jgi:hypothetical protein
VVFLKDPFTPERLGAMGLNERQVKAVLHVKQHGSIGNKEYQKAAGARERTAPLELGDVVEKGGVGTGWDYRSGDSLCRKKGAKAAVKAQERRKRACCLATTKRARQQGAPHSASSRSCGLPPMPCAAPWTRRSTSTSS